MLHKYVRSFVAFVVMLLFLGTSVLPAAAESVNITVKVDEGLDGKVKRGEGFPTSITLENKGEAFRGDLLIQYNPSYNTGGAITIHVDLPEGSTKTYQVSVPGLIEDSQSYYQNQPTIHLYKGDWDKGNEVSFKGENSLKPKYIDPNDQVVGILSENYDRLKELRTLPSIAMLPLTKDQLPKQGVGLEMLDFLVIDEYAVSQLEEEQQLAIQEWIRYGGILVAGGAPDASGSYGSLYHLLPMKMEEEKIGTTGFLLTAKHTDIPFKEIPIFTGAIEKGSEVLQTSSDQPAAIKKLYGNGMILQTSFSLGDQPLSSWVGYSAWFENFMKEAHQNSVMSSRYGQDLYDQLYWEFAEQNEFFPASNYTLTELMAIMLIYLIIIVPVLYLVLKRLDKREHSWWVIPSLAIIMSAIVFGLGAKDRISEPQLNQMGIYKMKDGVLTGLQASTLLSNRSGDYKLAIPKEQYRAVQHANNSFTVDPTLGAVMVEKRKEKEIIFNNVGYWSSKTIYGKAQKETEGGFTVDLSLKNNQLTGTIQNAYPYDFEEIFIWSGNKKVKIGPLKAGETLQVNQKIAQSFLTGPAMLNNSGMYPGSQADLEKMKIERLQYAAGVFLNGDSNNQPLIGGITKEAIVDVNIVGKDEKQNNLNLIISPFAAESDFLGKFSLTTEMLNTRVDVINGIVHEKGINGVPNEMIMEDGEYDYVLQLPEQVRGKNITFESVKLQMNGQSLQLSILNHKTGKYLPIKKDQRSLSLDQDDQVDQFFSKNGELFIKVHKNTNNGDPYVYLPQVTVKGEVTP
jgi:uncharacterized membrane protein YhaH (DUF805 family)